MEPIRRACATERSPWEFHAMTELVDLQPCRRALVRCSVRSAVFAGAAAAAMLGWAYVQHQATPTLHAQSGGSSDPDGDGLPTKLEVVLGTDPYYADSDLDGYSDVEEFARHSAPTKGWESPAAQIGSVGMGAIIQSGMIHALACMYFQDGDLLSKKLEFGFLLSGHYYPFPASPLGQQPTLTIVPSAVPGEVVAVYDAAISPAILRRTGEASLYCIVTGPNGLKVADAVNLASIENVIGQRLWTTTQSGESPGTTIQVPTGGGSTVFRPLGGQQFPPPSWSPGSVCSQTMSTVGLVGATVTQEVTSASCETGWDAYCDPSCAASVGTTMQMIDPTVLAGS
jgi:hypothetical protein